MYAFILYQDANGRRMGNVNDDGQQEAIPIRFHIYNFSSQCS